VQPSEDPPDDGESSLWKGLIERGQQRVAAGRGQAEKTYDKYKHRPLVDVGVRIYHRDRESAGTVVSAAVAFRLFLFFVPLLLFLVGILGFFAEVVSEEVVSDAGLSGEIASQINTALSQPSSTRWVAVVVGLFGMASTGRTLSKTLVAASCLAWRLPVRPRASIKAVGAIVGLIAGVGIVSLLVGRIRQELGVAVAGVSFLLAVAIYVVAWMIVMMVLPRSPSTDASALLPGSVLIGLTVAGLQLVSQLYLPGRFDRASELYGAIGTTIVVLGWFFIIGRVIVLAMAVNAVIYERFGSISQFVFSLPILRQLPRRFPKLRKPFGLEEDTPDLQESA
jgi:membrane protein